MKPMTPHALLARYALSHGQNLTDSEKSRQIAFTFGCVNGGLVCLFYLIFYTVYDAILFDGKSLDALQWATLPGLFFPLVPLLLRRGDAVTIAVAAPFSLVLFITHAYILGSGSGLHLFLILVLSNGLLHMGAGRRIETVMSAIIFILAVIGCELSFPEPSVLVRVDQTFLNTVFASVIVAIVLQLVVTTRMLIRQVEQAEAALAEEHARSEALLQNLLPDEIAARLKDRPGEVIADGLPAVTMLFADIVDFTPRSASRPPEEVVAFLNQIFSRFDELTAERGLEKIKTIGDAYMVAAGLPVARDDHAQIIADMAVAMRDEAVRLSAEMNEMVVLRIGIHSGPAIAGVIGTSKVFYDVWGDTVNTASRMESHGEPGRIQITGPTRALLGDAFVTTARGPVEIKGIGPMDTWWLDGRSSSV